MPEAVTEPRAPSRADYQAAAERLGAGKSSTLAGWTIVRDAHAHYWRAYRDTPCNITVSSSSAVDLSVALVTHDQGARHNAAREALDRVARWADRFEGDPDTVYGDDWSELLDLLDGALEELFDGYAITPDEYVRRLLQLHAERLERNVRVAGNSRSPSTLERWAGHAAGCRAALDHLGVSDER